MADSDDRDVSRFYLLDLIGELVELHDLQALGVPEKWIRDRFWKGTADDRNLRSYYDDAFRDAVDRGELREIGRGCWVLDQQKQEDAGAVPA